MKRIAELCRRVDVTEGEYKKANGLGRDEFARFSGAAQELLTMVRMEMATLAGEATGSEEEAAHRLAYFNSWVLLRGGFEP